MTKQEIELFNKCSNLEAEKKMRQYWHDEYRKEIEK